MKVLNVIKNIILDVLIVLMIIVIVFIYINRNAPVSVFGYYFFNVKTGSMQPTLSVGDNIIVKKEKEYKVGDVVTYKKDDIYVTHRIVKIDGNSVTTKGDANTTDDAPFDMDNILGKYVYKSSWLNFIINNKFLICLGIVLLYIIDLIIKNLRKAD